MRTAYPRAFGYRFAAGLGALSLALGVGAGPAAAQDEYVQQVRRLIQEAGRTFEARGYAMTHRIYTGALNTGAQEVVAVELSIGTEYQLMGACDRDCSNVDMIVRDAQGNEVGSDRLADDVPLVGVTPPRSGTYRVTMIMVACREQPCRYGIGIFGK